MNSQLKEKDRLIRLVDGLYPDYRANVISKEEYLRLKDDFNREIEAINVRIENLKNSDNAEDNDTKNEFLESFLSRGNIEKLDRALLLELIDEILVYEGGKIKIKMKCADAFENAIRDISDNKHIA